jgi:hypothetical protein
MAGFNWRRGLGPSLALIAATIGYAAWIGRAYSSQQAIRFWAIIAVLVMGELVLALATNYLAQTGREGLSRLIRGGVTLAFLGGAWWYAQRPSAAFTNEERAPLLQVEEHGERRLHHPGLGFSILHPGPGFVLTASQAYRADAQFYAFADQAGGESLTVGLFKGVGDSSASLRDLLEEMGKQAGALGGKGGAPVRVVFLQAPDTDPPRAELHAIVGEGRHYRMSGYGWKRPGQAPIAVLIAVMSPQADAHSDVLASFQP